MSSHDRHTSPDHPRNRPAMTSPIGIAPLRVSGGDAGQMFGIDKMPLVGNVNQEPAGPDTDADYQARMARPGPDDDAADAYYRTHANVGAGGGDDEGRDATNQKNAQTLPGQHPVAPRVGWVVEEPPMGEQLLFLIERTELIKRQKDEAAARETIDAAQKAEQLGDQRRRWVVRATASRIHRDSGGLLDGMDVVNQFRGLIDDNRTLAAKRDTDNVRVMLQRDGWADIGIEWRPALDQASDGAEPIDEWASVERKPARPWLVFTKTHTRPESRDAQESKEMIFRNGDPERFETFGEAVVFARAQGKVISERATRFVGEGWKVRFL